MWKRPGSHRIESANRHLAPRPLTVVCKLDRNGPKVLHIYSSKLHLAREIAALSDLLTPFGRGCDLARLDWKPACCIATRQSRGRL
jgi:hypothetical protein